MKRISDKKGGRKKQSANVHQKNYATFKEPTDREDFLRQETSQYERIGRNTDDGHLSKERSADHSSSQSQSAMSVDHQLLSKERSSPKTSTNNVKLIPDADSHGKRKPYEAIAYVLPVKRNKKNTVDYCFEPQMKQKEQFVSQNLNQLYWTNNRQEHQSEFETSPTHLMKNAESKIIINDMTKITVPDSSN